MSKLPMIDKDKIFDATRNPNNLYISKEFEQWLIDVVDVLNHWIQFGQTQREHDVEELAKLIMAINREKYPITEVR